MTKIELFNLIFDTLDFHNVENPDEVADELVEKILDLGFDAEPSEEDTFKDMYADEDEEVDDPFGGTEEFND